MKQDRVYIALVVGLVILLIVGLLFQPNKISWKHTYSKSEKGPFASRALYELLGDVFPAQAIEPLHIPANEFASAREKDSIRVRKCNYILLGDHATFDLYDTRAILKMARKGDHVLISSEYLYGPLADSLGIFTTYQPNMDVLHSDTVRLNFQKKKLYSSRGFSMRPGENAMYVHVPDSVEGIEVLSVNSHGHPVFVSKKLGEGAVYFHSVPLAFTNYYMIHADNHGYVSRCLSYLPVLPVYWDEYYKTGRLESVSPVRVLLQNPALKTAYIISLVLVALYMLFQSKRRQRIIPVIEPFENSTLQFVATVAQLYYNKGDHTSLAKKKLLYLTEKMRQRYNMPIDFTEDAIQAISARSGVDVSVTRNLFKHMEYIQRAYSLTESELIKFNKLIEEFWFLSNENYHSTNSKLKI